MSRNLPPAEIVSQGKLRSVPESEQTVTTKRPASGEHLFMARSRAPSPVVDQRKTLDPNLTDNAWPNYVESVTCRLAFSSR